MKINLRAWIKGERANRIKTSPFRLSLIRWHEFVSIVFLSLFANIVASLRFNINGSKTVFFSVFSLLISAISSFNVHRIMEEIWLDVTMRKNDDQINEFYKSFRKKDEKNLWIYFFVSLGTFGAYLLFSNFP